MPTSSFQPIRLLDPGCWYKFTHLITKCVDPDQSASSEPTDLDLRYLQRQDISGFSKKGLMNHFCLYLILSFSNQYVSGMKRVQVKWLFKGNTVCKGNAYPGSTGPGLTLVLLNPDIPCLCKQCRARSVGFWRSQLIWICTVCHSLCGFISIIWIKESDWLIIRSGLGILIYSAWQGLT